VAVAGGDEVAKEEVRVQSGIRRRGLLALSGAVFALSVAVPGAHAGVLVASAPSCDTQVLTQPFTPWMDLASYVIAPGGAFEGGAAGWALSGGAAVGAGNEPWNVTAATDSSSLGLPAGSSATSATMCVGTGHPDLRIFARRSGGSIASTLRVDVLFEDAAGVVHTLTIGNVSAGSSWTLTPDMPVVANLLPLLPNSMTPVRFAFTPQDSAAWSIDDVYVDPWRGG
jgi:hypothetical protein